MNLEQPPTSEGPPAAEASRVAAAAGLLAATSAIHFLHWFVPFLFHRVLERSAGFYFYAMPWLSVLQYILEGAAVLLLIRPTVAPAVRSLPALLANITVAAFAVRCILGPLVFAIYTFDLTVIPGGTMLFEWGLEISTVVTIVGSLLCGIHVTAGRGLGALASTGRLALVAAVVYSLVVLSRRLEPDDLEYSEAVQFYYRVMRTLSWSHGLFATAAICFWVRVARELPAANLTTAEPQPADPTHPDDRPNV